MSIRPVDLQVLIPKTAEYSKQLQGEINKQNMDQTAFAQVAQKHAEQQQSLVIETNQSENSVNKDGGSKQEQERKKKKKKEVEEKEKKASESTGLFDIRI